MIRALVVDDSALMRKAIGTMLTEAGGFEVDTARNGRDALDRIADRPPDVVTLDINMPEMDGLTCLAEIMRRSPRPVVMVSSLTEAGALATLEALELGAVDFVAKPGGTVSLNIDQTRAELVDKVRRAAGARLRITGGLSARMRTQAESVGGASSAGSRAGGSAGSSVAGTGQLTGRRNPPEAARTGAGRGPVPRARAGHLVDVVLIGASTGGPAVVSDIVTRLPAGFGPAVVIAQHMPASFTGPFAHRLNGASALEVREVTGTEPLRPGTVYLGRGDADVVLRRQGSGLSIRCVPAGAEYRWHPSVDRLVASALAVLSAQRLLGVLMTGMGDDGADQMTRLMQGGGRTIAESEESAVVWGMPGELVKRSGATCVLSATRVVSQIENWC